MKVTTLNFINTIFRDMQTHQRLSGRFYYISVTRAAQLAHFIATDRVVAAATTMDFHQVFLWQSQLQPKPSLGG